MSKHTNNFPKLHNAMWPGLVGKGTAGAEPSLDLDTMLDLTANAEVDGVKFDGVDLFLFDPHVSIDISDDDLKAIADRIHSRGFVVGSVVAPVWSPTGGGSAMGNEEERKQFVQQVVKACRIASRLRQFGVRPYGIVRIDSACSVDDWAKDPENNTRLIAQTFREAADVAENFGERLAAEGEICWGGMHSWREMVKLLELVARPKTVGFQADMAHTLLYTLGYNAEPADRIVPESFDWDPDVLDEALRRLTVALRPWTIDFHVAQNDATVHGSGSHDKTGRHCRVNDPNGKLNIAYHAGFWLRNETGELIKATRHICWDGCMFPNDVMLNRQTWNDILSTMIAVRDLHGWNEEPKAAKPAKEAKVEVSVRAAKKAKRAAKKPARAAKRAAKKTPKKAAAKKAAPRRAARKAVKAKARKAAKKPMKKALKRSSAKKKAVKKGRKK